MALLAYAPATPAREMRPIAFTPASAITLSGDSNLHAFKSAAQAWTITAAVSTSPEVGPRVANLDVVIKVRDLKSGHRGLDDNMYRALDADRHPTIRFTATRCQARVTGPGEVDAEATGILSVAGAERTTTVTATGRLQNGRWRLKGSKALSMKAFGITPPVLLGGTIRCADRIVIDFDLEGQEAVTATRP